MSAHGISIANIVQICSTLFLGIVAILAPTLAESVKAWWYKPKLDIVVRLTPPACQLTNAFIPLLVAGVTNPQSCFVYRFEVHNNGKTEARKCEAVIESLAICNASGDFQELPKYSPVSLIWGSGYEGSVDINTGRRFYCDLFKVPSAQYQHVVTNVIGGYVNLADSSTFDIGVVLDVKSAFLSQPNRLPPGKYKLGISVYSENADTIKKIMYISWTGKWCDSEEEMFKECVLST
ncbi:MAG: hypothetical protein WCC11_04625 [Gammaproteobacteria bacterium]